MTCTKCKETYSDVCKNFYSSNEKFLQPCKSCRSAYQKKYNVENAERLAKYHKFYYIRNREFMLDHHRDYYNKNKEDRLEYCKQYRTENKHKLKEYNDKRYHKNHKISEYEWQKCKEYFDNGCAYCGLSESEHRILYKQDLHKEHVVLDGRNDIKNCVPSCKSCNSSKRKQSFNNWYNCKNKKYTIFRYHRICTWVKTECMKILRPNKSIN